MLSEEEVRDAKPVLWPYVAGDFFHELFQSTLPPKMTEEDIKGMSDSITKIHKVGVKIPMTWEALAGSQRKGHYEPTGNKYTQWMRWWIGKQVFRFWKFVERRLSRFRHYESVSGYDWEDAGYREFEQKRKWVEDASTD